MQHVKINPNLKLIKNFNIVVLYTPHKHRVFGSVWLGWLFSHSLKMETQKQPAHIQLPVQPLSLGKPLPVGPSSAALKHPHVHTFIQFNNEICYRTKINFHLELY